MKMIIRQVKTYYKIVFGILLLFGVGVFVWQKASNNINSDQTKNESDIQNEQIVGLKETKLNQTTSTQPPVVVEEKKDESLSESIKDDRVIKPKENQKENLTELLDGKNIPYQEKSDLIVVTDDYERVAKTIETSDFVEFSEPEGIVKALTTPNDTSYSSQSAYLSQISAQSAWDLGTGSSSVKIAVVDTGINGLHEDLSGRVGAGRNIIFDKKDNGGC